MFFVVMVMICLVLIMIVGKYCFIDIVNVMVNVIRMGLMRSGIWM